MTDVQEDLVREERSVNLPMPTTRRWKPLRLGLVELFHYDSEEFWFNDGHLLLRGNNGTGKSKVLSLTMPFLLDANLKSSRIEPDGDSGKKMSWNLLMGNAYDRRIGYAWIEFGCLTATGEPQFVTLGAGMLATAAKQQPDAWYFMLDGGATSPRMNRDLWLLSGERQVLTKERLKEAIQGHGQIYPTATAYRRAVDERLFDLGTARYDALIDTLIQLRQPQLSKKPDEAALSAALTQALPPIADTMLVEVADALGKLEDERQTLEQYNALSVAVRRFEQRYRAYAATRTRREARVLRKANTDFDTASKARNNAEEQAAEAADEERIAIAEEAQADLALADARKSWEVLKEDPANADATRLDRAQAQVKRSKEELTEAAKAVEQAKKKTDAASSQLREYSNRVDAHIRSADIASTESLAAARSANLGGEVLESALLVTGGAGLHTLEPGVYERERAGLHGVAAERRRSLTVVRSLMSAVDRQRANFDGRQRRRDEALDDLQEAREERAETEEKFDQEGRAHLESWSQHVGKLNELRVNHDETLAALAEWVINVGQEHPGRQALDAAHASALVALSDEEAAIKAERQSAQRQLQALQTERSALQLGTDPEPPVPATRDPQVRVQRPGAPFWKLVDFTEGLPANTCAALEAALEASGILDAWVSPSGALVAADGETLALDTTLVARAPRASSLARFLVPVAAQAQDMSIDTVPRILQGIACDEADSGDEAWIGLDGRYRIGPVSGVWLKAQACYIGATSRAMARARRISEIDALLDEFDQTLASLQARIDAITTRKDLARSELQSAPSESLVRNWHQKCVLAIDVERRSSGRLDQADRELAEAKEQLDAAVGKLELDAADLHLPTTADALAAIEEGLLTYEAKLAKFLDAAEALRTLRPELALQQQRRDDAQAALEEASEKEFQRQEELTIADAELRTLESTVGLKVKELMAELERLRLLVGQCEAAQDRARADNKRAGEKRAIAAQLFEGKQVELDTQTAARASVVSRLQEFAASGILAAGAPEIAVPDSAVSWTIEPALTLARRLEQALAHVNDSDDAWHKVQKHINDDLSVLQTALSGLSYQCTGEQTDFGLVVRVVYQNRSEQPDRLVKLLDREIADRTELLTNKEKEILEGHLQAEIAAEVQRLLKMADDHVSAINEELKKRPTSTGVKFRLLWEPLAEAEGAPLGLSEARKRLLNKSSDLWSTEDREVVGRMLQERIKAERDLAESGAQASTSLSDQLARALDYRKWHRFKVERWQANQWKKLSGPASSGERALGLTVPLFAAVASFYGRTERALAPRLMLLDEAFAGIDDAARAHCMALIREFDLDFIITSEREWACYAELPGVSICQLQRREDVDAVFVSRWTWDGKAKKQQPDPDSRFPPRP
jgi:uncharacterized protein (TIGR02680 family)